jgi:hypothetical protein
MITFTIKGGTKTAPNQNHEKGKREQDFLQRLVT